MARVPIPRPVQFLLVVVLIAAQLLSPPVAAALSELIAAPASTQAGQPAPAAGWQRRPGETREAFFTRVGEADPERLQLAAVRALEYVLNNPAAANASGDDFEQLVDLICAARRSGVVGGMDRDYQDLVQGLRHRYADIRTYALAFLDVDVADAAYGLDLCGRATDAIECLILTPSLPTILSWDTPAFEDRVGRSREGLYRLSDYLREVSR